MASQKFNVKLLIIQVSTVIYYLGSWVLILMYLVV